ncbi:MAG: endopeptidase La [Proteobacteria bacterium SG_bin7]|nr:MAG: endopeptidase La [Proteobacteria bacterium SG_bin7]
MSLPLVPVKNVVLFPGLSLPLAVGRQKSIAAIEDAQKSSDKNILVVTQKNVDTENVSFNDLHHIGTRASIRKVSTLDRNKEVTVLGLTRVRIKKIDITGPFLKAEYEELPHLRSEGTAAEALQRSILEQVKKMESYTNPKGVGFIAQMLHQLQDLASEVYLLTTILNMEQEKSQQILETDNLLDAMSILYEFLTHEVQVLEVQSQIASKTHSQLSQQQREHILRQQMEAIREELGEKDSANGDISTLKEKLKKSDLPDYVKKEVERELRRLEQMSNQAHDYQLLRSYLEFVADLPWNRHSEDKLDLAHAKNILNEEHYDLEDVKGRILEHLAVLKLNPKAKAPIICFVGAPGVGKTSLGESIARALGRKFERMSLGGLHDESELRGHRRTYVGAMPGRILQAIRRSGSSNPILMMDEIDKLGRDFRGDPAAALMEILDPSQNTAFRDNYLDLPYDLSKVFFILTANSLESIPAPLLDRLEVIRLAGYTEDDKVAIAKKYLIPMRLKEAGLNADQLNLSDAVLKKMIRDYTREAGLREVSRLIGKLARKVAVKVAEDPESVVHLKIADISTFLGPEKFFKDQLRKEPTVGVVAGLAWTPYGGDVLYVEASLLPGGKGLTLTGQLGEVMKESAQAAQSYIWSHFKQFGLETELLRKSGVHIHVPEGATPKDGPSAGVTMATALASLYRSCPVRSDTAMTGEITLSGLVLPIGGLKEKTLAAHRAGIKRLIAPMGNQKDLVEIPKNVLNEIEFVFVEVLDEVFANSLLVKSA